MIMTRKRRPLYLTSIALALTTVVAIGVANSAASPSGGSNPKAALASAAPPFLTIGPAGDAVFAGVGADVFAAPPGAQPPITETAARASLSASKLVNGLAGSKQPTSIRLAEYENLFGATGADGNETPSVPRQLAWFVEYDGVQNTIKLSLPLQHASDAPPTGPLPANYSCQLYAAVSATTGAVIDVFDHCGTS